MYVCSCNALTDRDIRSAIQGGATRPSEVYSGCGRRAECGNCMPTVLCLLREACIVARARHASTQAYEVAAAA